MTLQTHLRPYHGAYPDSMKRAVWVQDLADLLAYLRCQHLLGVTDMRDLTQRFYGRDSRSGWMAWIISYRSHPLLWSDGPLDGVTHVPASGPNFGQRFNTG